MWPAACRTRVRLRAGARRVGPRFAVLPSVALLATLASCIDLGAAPAGVASVAFDSVASPSVVVGDSLRDTLGVVRPVRGTAFSGDGDAIAGAVFRYRALDRGVSLDTITGLLVGDSVSTTPVRIVAQAGGLQSVVVSLFVVPRPDTLSAVSALDTLAFSLTDTTANVSDALSVRLRHLAAPGEAPSDSAVGAYVVSFAIVLPTDTLVARLVDDSGRPSRVDTTDQSGVAGRKIRLGPKPPVADSVVVLATARYRGAPVRGSPVRLVLRTIPR